MGTPRARYQPLCERISALRYSSPASIALTFGNQSISYEQLDIRAGKFAAYLLQCGLTSNSNSAVAICMSRSFDWIIAALSIMRIGAAYVPLDPTWPDSRLRFALQDCGAKALVAPAALLDRLEADVYGIDPSRDAAAISRAPRLEASPVGADSVAYVIYTSGSTGTPKGVEITHASLSHLIEWHLDTFQVTRHDRASHLAGLGFDAAVWEIWPHLSAGATLCLAEDAVRSSPELIQQWMIRERVTIGFVPTVHANPLLASPWPATTKLRFLLTGGDVLNQAPSIGLPFAVVNNYGPTECTVVSTSGVITPGTYGTPVIGRPIDGASVYLLNEEGKQVSEGEIGEIYIGGSGVGRGYRNLPEVSEKRFLPDPFAAEPNARMYRSGDLGLRRIDGQIEFHGRKDRQVKIRGQRVELDEIGCVLSRHPAVASAVAIANTTARGELQLVAYFLPKEKSEVLAITDLQEYLLRHLPAYMVPGVYVKLNALPLSPSGKVDLNLLPSPSATPLWKGKALTLQADPIEIKLLRLLQNLLKNDEIGSEDNFFLAGGHSLLGMQLLMHLSEDFDVDVSLQQLFEASTIKELASLVKSKLAADRLLKIWKDLLRLQTVPPNSTFYELGGDAALVSSLQARIIAEFGQNITLAELQHVSTLGRQTQLIQGELTNAALPLGVLALQPSGKGNPFFWVHIRKDSLARAMGCDRPVLFVELTSEDLGWLGATPTLEDIAACLLRHILETQKQGPYTLGGFCIGGVLAFEVAHQMRTLGHEVSLLTLLDTPSPQYYGTPHLLGPRLRHPGYLVRRITQQGLRLSFVKAWDRVLERMPESIVRRYTKSRPQLMVGLDPIRKMMEAAASQYLPDKYLGKVLLLLASDHPPHLDFFQGWQPLTGEMLEVQFIEANHTQLTRSPVVDHVGDVITSHLNSEEEFSFSAPPEASEMALHPR